MKCCDIVFLSYLHGTSQHKYKYAKNFYHSGIIIIITVCSGYQWDNGNADLTLIFMQV